jgi:hypothetical protein
MLLPPAVFPHQLIEPLPLHHQYLLVTRGAPVDSPAAYPQLAEQLLVAPDAEPDIRTLDFIGPRLVRQYRSPEIVRSRVLPSYPTGSRAAVTRA